MPASVDRGRNPAPPTCTRLTARGRGPARDPLRPRTGPPRGLVTTVEHLGDLVDALGPRRGVASRRAQVDMPKAGGDLVDGDARLEQVGGPVGAERMRVRQPLGHSSGVAVAAHEPVHGDGGEGERVLVAMATEADEQRLLVEQPDPARERMHRGPRIECLLNGLGDRDLALTAALAVDVEAVVAGVGTRAPQVPSAEAAQLRGPQATVAQDPQEGDMLRRNIALYVALRTMLRSVLEREGDRPAYALRARIGERGDSGRWVVNATYFEPGWHLQRSDKARSRVARLDQQLRRRRHGTQRCVLDRTAAESQGPCPLPPSGMVLAFVASLQLTRNMLRRRGPISRKRR
jgi:hypothetical protein